MFGISPGRGALPERADLGFVTIFLFLPLTGCAHTSATAGPPQLAASLGSPQPSRASDDAAGAGQNQRELAGAVLERSAFVRAVLRHNPTVESARQGFYAARARIGQAGVLEDPQLDLGVAPFSIVSSKAPFGYQVQVSQKLPWFGKRSLEAASASAEAAAVKADFASLQRDLALTAVVLYDQYYVAARSLEVNAQHTALMQAMQAAATAQLEAGRGSAQDPLQAEAELAHLEHDAVKLLSEREVVVAQMNELLHRSPELPLPPPPLELPPANSRELSAQQLEAVALGASSELTAAREHIKAEQARADQARREAYPDVTLSASYNSMWDMPEHRFMLGLGFNLPIQGGRRGGAVDEALALRAQFESEAVKLTDAARTRVFVAVKRLQESAHLLELFEKRLLPVARDQIEAARAGFTASRNPFAAVIEAEKNLRAVELEHELARAEYHGRRAELDRALGRVPGLDWKGAQP